jgi:hypothetical protein
VGKKYGSKGYPHTGNAAHMGSISCMWIFLLGILIFKGLTARRLYKSFGVKGLMRSVGRVQSSPVIKAVQIWLPPCFEGGNEVA